MPAKVVDASVIAAILFNEEDASMVVELIGDADLWAPRLLPFELSSVACNESRFSPKLQEGVMAALELLAALNIS